jgi:hypothetical protein
VTKVTAGSLLLLKMETTGSRVTVSMILKKEEEETY